MCRNLSEVFRRKPSPSSFLGHLHKAVNLGEKMNRLFCTQNRLARGLHLAFLSKHFSVAARRCADSSPDNGVYELRTYKVKPKSFGKYLETTNEVIPTLRVAHSPVTGFWSTELGGLNEVVHIWRYDNFAHRTAVRKALSEDEQWKKDGIGKLINHMRKQENLVMNAVPWYKVKPPMTTNGVYELRCYSIKPGKADQWFHRIQQGLPARCELSEPAGIWFSEIGPLSTAVVLWPYKSLDERIELRKAALEIEEWVEAVRDCTAFITRGTNKILLPLPFSPWK